MLVDPRLELSRKAPILSASSSHPSDSSQRSSEIEKHNLTDILAHPITLFSHQIGGWQIPDLDLQVYVASADLTSMLIARANRITEIGQPVMIPTSSLCQSDVIGLLRLSGKNMVPFQHLQHQLVGHQATSVYQV